MNWRPVFPGQPTTFGIGTPGAISPRTGLLKNSNTVCMNGQPVKADLEKLLGRKIEIQNDANCFAMAEALLGAGRGKKLVFGVIMGTGCGGGIVYKGEVFTGPQAIAGEWGHMSIDPSGPLCFCGRRGCVETFISGGGLENRYAEKFGVRRPLKEIEREYFAGEPQAVEFMQEFFDHFGRALANLIDILDPDIVVLGGGVSNFRAIYTEGVAAVRKYRFHRRDGNAHREKSAGRFRRRVGRGVGGSLGGGKKTAESSKRPISKRDKKSAANPCLRHTFCYIANDLRYRTFINRCCAAAFVRGDGRVVAGALAGHDGGGGMSDAACVAARRHDSGQ